MCSQDQPLDLGLRGVNQTVVGVEKSSRDYFDDKQITFDLPNAHSVEPVNYHRNAQRKVCMKELNKVTTEVEVEQTPKSATAATVLQSYSSPLSGHPSKPCQNLPASTPGAVISRKSSRENEVNHLTRPFSETVSPRKSPGENDKHLTHPFSEKECQQFERAMNIKQKLAHSSTLTDVQHSVFTVGMQLFSLVVCL